MINHKLIDDVSHPIHMCKTEFLYLTISLDARHLISIPASDLTFMDIQIVLALGESSIDSKFRVSISSILVYDSSLQTFL